MTLPSVLILSNEPALPEDDPDYASEAGVNESVEAIAKALTDRGARVEQLQLGNTIFPLVEASRRNDRPDVVFNLCETFAGKSAGEMNIPALLDLLDWPYTGSTAACLSLTREKSLTKSVLLGLGLATPEFRPISPAEDFPAEWIESLLSLGPIIIKPAHEDASLGISSESVVDSLDQAKIRVADVANKYGAILVERFIAGRELNVAVVGFPEPRLLPVAEILFEKDPENPWHIVTYEAKWSPDSLAANATPAQCPANLSATLEKRIRSLALATFRAVGARHYVRMDIRLDHAETPYVLEINANPDLSPTAGFARQWLASGRSYADFAVEIIRAAKTSWETA